MFLCPACLSLYENGGLCVECNSDLPGDIELVSLNDALPKINLAALKEHLMADDKLANYYRNLLIERLDKLIDLKNSRLADEISETY